MIKLAQHHPINTKYDEDLITQYDCRCVPGKTSAFPDDSCERRFHHQVVTLLEHETLNGLEFPVKINDTSRYNCTICLFLWRVTLRNICWLDIIVCPHKETRQRSSTSLPGQTILMWYVLWHPEAPAPWVCLCKCCSPPCSTRTPPGRPWPGTSVRVWVGSWSETPATTCLTSPWCPSSCSSGPTPAPWLWRSSRRAASSPPKWVGHPSVVCPGFEISLDASSVLSEPPSPSNSRLTSSGQHCTLYHLDTRITSVCVYLKSLLTPVQDC